MKKTKKYIAACNALGLPVGAGVPHEAVYGMLVLRGYEWSDGKWVAQQIEDALCGDIRVTGLPCHIDDLVLLCVEALENAGAHVNRISRPYSRRKSDKVMVYVNFTYDRF